MHTQTKSRRDTFAFSRGGMTTVGGYFGMPMVAADRLNKRVKQDHDEPTVNETKKEKRMLWRRRKSA